MPIIEVKSTFLKFLLRFSLLYIFLVLLYVGVQSVTNVHIEYWIAIFMVIYIITVGVYLILLIARHDDPLKFPTYLNLSIVLKLLFYTGFCAWIIYQDRENSTQNLTLFFTLYLVTTTYEVRSLIKGKKQAEPTK